MNRPSPHTGPLRTTCRRLPAACLGATLLLVAGVPGRASVDFQDQVLPVLKENCLPCHDRHTRTSGFSVESLDSVLAGGARHGAAVMPGAPEQSPLIKVLRGQIEPRMPLGRAFSEDRIQLIEQWIGGLSATPRTNSPAEPYWAYVKPAAGPPPEAKDSPWIRNGIDSFILKRLQEEGLSPAPPASRRTLIRRLFFDLLGVPPEPAEVEAFADDPSPNAYEALVDRLLADPRYGERWGRHWLDLARYSDTNGYEGDPEYYHTWRYRDYVIDAFNGDKPYDLFVKEQLAGDEFFEMMSAGALPPPDPESVVALTFLRLAPFTEPRGEEDRHVLLSEMTSTVGSVFLGLTVGCAQCHDHKYDLLPTRDFYRLKAFFAAVQIDPPRPGDIQQLGGPQPASFVNPARKERWDRERAALEQQLQTTEKSFALFYEPLLERLKAYRMEAARDRLASPEPEPPTFKDLKKAIRDDQGYRKFSIEEHRQFTDFRHRVLRLKNAVERRKPLAMSLRNADGPPYGPNVSTTYVLERGHWNRKGEPVEPGFPSAIEGHSQPAPIDLDPFGRYPTRGRRLALAKWIASPENPLTARVMVNRLWQWHFGRGIVDTPSDFGKNGAAPTHPRLLDWLAGELVERNWSLKAMHRLMVTSGAYRRSSLHSDPDATRIDPQNRYLWRFQRRRLEGEAVRDSILTASGRLNGDRGGPPVFPPLPPGLDEAQKVQGTNTWEPMPGPRGRKRSVYIFQRRSLSMPLMETFDAPVPNASCARRETSVSVLQALTMYDGEFVNQEARHFAERVKREGGAGSASRIRQAFQIALGRDPRPEETARASQLLEESPSGDGLTALCRVLLNSNEFVYID